MSPPLTSAGGDWPGANTAAGSEGAVADACTGVGGLDGARAAGSGLVSGAGGASGGGAKQASLAAPCGHSAACRLAATSASLAAAGAAYAASASPRGTRSGRPYGGSGVRCLITGGGGYVGLHLARLLAAEGHSVALFDLRAPDAQTLQATAGGASGGAGLGSGGSHGDVGGCVAAGTGSGGGDAAWAFHVASYGMSGVESLRTEVIHQVNVGGTANLVAAAQAAGVRRFVHVSSYNAVWARQPVRGGDENSAPYLSYNSCPDAYSRTKAAAERMVLEANGSPLGTPSPPQQRRSRASVGSGSGELGNSGSGGLDGSGGAVLGRGGAGVSGSDLPGGGVQVSGGGGRAALAAGAPVLLTCAVRPPAIYGPGELRHTPRILAYARAGLLRFRFGSHEARADWWVRPAHAWANGLHKRAHGFEPTRGGGPCAGSDGQEVQWQGCGWTQWDGGEGGEVYKTGVEHWYKIDRAQKELGWAPQQFDFQEIIGSYTSFAATPAVPLNLSAAGTHGLRMPPRGPFDAPASGGVASSSSEDDLTLPSRSFTTLASSTSRSSISDSSTNLASKAEGDPGGPDPVGPEGGASREAAGLLGDHVRQPAGQLGLDLPAMATPAPIGGYAAAGVPFERLLFIAAPLLLLLMALLLVAGGLGRQTPEL
ncbi:putative short-chain dehydrogenase/reductase family 42E member 2 [Tetrabaena socialis]|uniref:Putative short-chain dehydrogenase/reductase family 42E member 2 n=1 Tax=Tetrabaena socialis TaxID=47790 RepID=A0A2J8AC56_9CHLO|nr:putative short-chain dehydrogenase/reductase family 42E member 2 [Tetrabaena socialis]|eukprot:PNH10096.1 putative short-chain dehydrogenase/reductase family 42E member 2 [Tetrabaena socialis]